MNLCVSSVAGGGILTTKQRREVRDILDTARQKAGKSLWRNRDFLLLWGGQGVSVLGTRVSSLALPLLVLATTHSAAQAGLITSARMIPYLVFGLPAGALMDRWNRKTTMIVCDVARCVALGSVPLAWAFRQVSLIQLTIVALVQGNGVRLLQCGRDGLTAQCGRGGRSAAGDGSGLGDRIGGRTDRAGNGGRRHRGGEEYGRGRGLRLSGGRGHLSSLGRSRLGFIRVPFQTDHDDGKEHTLAKDVREGLRFLWADSRLRTLALASWALSFLYAPVSLAMIVLARDQPACLSLVSSASSSVLSALGGLLGAWLAPRIRERLPFGAVILGTIALQALVTPLVGLANFRRDDDLRMGDRLSARSHLLDGLHLLPARRHPG